MFVRLYVCVCAQICMYVYLFVCLFVCPPSCLLHHVYVRVCVCVCVCVRDFMSRGMHMRRRLKFNTIIFIKRIYGCVRAFVCLCICLFVDVFVCA